MRARRDALGYTQKELGFVLGIQAPTIGLWERGQVKIEHAIVLHLALLSVEYAVKLNERKAS